MSTESPEWEVNANGIHEDTTLQEGGTGIQTVHKVPYTILSGPAAGTRHEVVVAPAMFHVEGVRQAIMEHSARIHGIANLRNDDA
jgi:hypothetical protein